MSNTSPTAHARIPDRISVADYRDLVAKGAVSRSAYEKVKADAESASAELNTARAQADVARTFNVSQSTISRLAIPGPFGDGLGVHEALCRGLPALVSRTAGVAERYPAGLNGLLIPDPDSAADLADRLRDWRAGLERYRAEFERSADTASDETNTE